MALLVCPLLNIDPPPFEDELLAMKICENGPEVLPTVDELVIEAHRKLNAKSNIGYQSPS